MRRQSVKHQEEKNKLPGLYCILDKNIQQSQNQYENLENTRITRSQTKIKNNIIKQQLQQLSSLSNNIQNIISTEKFNSLQQKDEPSQSLSKSILKPISRQYYSQNNDISKKAQIVVQNQIKTTNSKNSNQKVKENLQNDNKGKYPKKIENCIDSKLVKKRDQKICKKEIELLMNCNYVQEIQKQNPELCFDEMQFYNQRKLRSSNLQAKTIIGTFNDNSCSKIISQVKLPEEEVNIKQIQIKKEQETVIQLNKMNTQQVQITSKKHQDSIIHKIIQPKIALESNQLSTKKIINQNQIIHDQEMEDFSIKKDIKNELMEFQNNLKISTNSIETEQNAPSKLEINFNSQVQGLNDRNKQQQNNHVQNKKRSISSNTLKIKKETFNQIIQQEKDQTVSAHNFYFLNQLENSDNEVMVDQQKDNVANAETHANQFKSTQKQEQKTIHLSCQKSDQKQRSTHKKDNKRNQYSYSKRNGQNFSSEKQKNQSEIITYDENKSQKFQNQDHDNSSFWSEKQTQIKKTDKPSRKYADQQKDFKDSNKYYKDHKIKDQERNLSYHRDHNNSRKERKNSRQRSRNESRYLKNLERSNYKEDCTKQNNERTNTYETSKNWNQKNNRQSSREKSYRPQKQQEIIRQKQDSQLNLNHFILHLHKKNQEQNKERLLKSLALDQSQINLQLQPVLQEKKQQLPNNFTFQPISLNQVDNKAIDFQMHKKITKSEVFDPIDSFSQQICEQSLPVNFSQQIECSEVQSEYIQQQSILQRYRAQLQGENINSQFIQTQNQQSTLIINQNNNNQIISENLKIMENQITAEPQPVLQIKSQNIKPKSPSTKKQSNQIIPNIKDSQLDRLDIFQTVDVFRAGTFKFEKNIHYSEQIQTFENDQLKRIESDIKNSKKNLSQEQINMIKMNRLENIKKELKPHLKYIKTFVPIFPWLYENLDIGSSLGRKKSLCLNGKQIYRNPNSEALNTYEIIHRRAQIKFSVIENKLLKYEESRQNQINLQNEEFDKRANGNFLFADYLLELDFQNIKHIWICKDPNFHQGQNKKNKQDENYKAGSEMYNYYQKKSIIEEKENNIRKLTYLTILIQLKRPCQALKIGPNKDFSSEILSTDKNQNINQKHNPTICNQVVKDRKTLSEIDEINPNLLKNRSKSSVLYKKVIKNYLTSQGTNQKSEEDLKIDEEFKQPADKKNTPALVRSPFNMTSNLESENKNEWFLKNGAERSKDDIAQVNFSTLVNYWNNNQVIHMAGIATKAHLETFLKTAKKANPNIQIRQDNQNISELGINFLEIDELKRELLIIRHKGLQFSDQLNKMRPSLRFSIMALLSANKFNIFNKGLIDFMEMLNNGGWNSQDMTADFGAFVIDQINLFKELDYKDDSSKKIEELFKILYVDQSMIEDFKRMQTNQNILRQRRVLVTPTLFHYTVAKEEESNKVIRQYQSHLSQFIRLSFVDEQLEKGFYFTDNSRFLLGYIHSILKYGFYTGRGLKCTFLSYSNSQLKNHTCWFLAQVQNGVNQQKIVESMGNFNNEKNILKRYARRGQCFSTTKNVQLMDKNEVNQQYHDIERNGHVFSDGCGLIHPDLALKIANIYKFSKISAFQVRLGGAKGVLAVQNCVQAFQNPQNADGYKILLRKSQVKFSSENLTLDIVRCATYSQGFLNRQIIVLLHCLGVPINYFLKKQQLAKQYFQLQSIQKRIQEKIDKIHQKFGNILSNNYEDFSLDYTIQKNMRLKDLARDMKLSFEQCKTFQATLKQALIKGLDIMKEPVFSSILYSMQLNQYMNLKKKARILLPDSCVLMGIIDPTGTLKENQIFVQTRKDNFSIHQHGQGLKNRKNRMEQAEILSSIDSLAEIIEGDVLVTRNPCTHPGDIRLLKCVDVPELRYCFNVVVFSSMGERPQPNMMSGGDLDGDVYFITWDKELLSFIDPKNINEPADYSKSDIIKEKPDSEELSDYFVFYLQRDVLGVVSTLWMMLTDYYGQDGPTHENCIALSHMCSVAVDFAKHGECVSKQNYSKMQKIIEEFPDFLEKGDINSSKKTYESNGILGHLYRDVKCDEALAQFIENDWKNSIKLNYELDTNILNLAKQDSQDKSNMHKYLIPCFEKIVKPMTLYFKKTMMYFQMANEGELYANDLKFRLCHYLSQDDKTFYSGDPGSKTEDALQNLNTMKRQITDKFQEIFQEIIKKALADGDKNASLNMSVALYLATYFDSNQSGNQYFKDNRDDPQFYQFFLNWNQVQQENLQSFNGDSFINKLRASVSFYHQICVEAEQGNQKKMRKLLQSKKIFCIPWLLAGDIILVSYPDKYDSPIYNDTIQKNCQKKKQQIDKAQQQINKFSSQPFNTQPDQILKMNRAQKLEKIFGLINKDNTNDQIEKENQNKNIEISNSKNFLESGQDFQNVSQITTKNQNVDRGAFQVINLQNNITYPNQSMTLPVQTTHHHHEEKPSFLGILSSVYDQFIEMNLEEIKQKQQQNDQQKL